MPNKKKIRVTIGFLVEKRKNLKGEPSRFNHFQGIFTQPLTFIE